MRIYIDKVNQRTQWRGSRERTKKITFVNKTLERKRFLHSQCGDWNIGFWLGSLKPKLYSSRDAGTYRAFRCCFIESSGCSLASRVRLKQLRPSSFHPLVEAPVVWYSLTVAALADGLAKNPFTKCKEKNCYAAVTTTYFATQYYG